MSEVSERVIRRLHAEKARLRLVLGQAIAFADIDVSFSVDDVDQRAGYTLTCEANEVEVPASAYDDLAQYVRDKQLRGEA